MTAVSGVRGGHQLIRVPGQPSPPVCLLGISIDRLRGDVSFEPIQLGYKILDLFLDIFGMLGPHVSVVYDSQSLDRYLVMSDERSHTAQGGLEWREPIGGLFRNI